MYTTPYCDQACSCRRAPGRARASWHIMLSYLGLTSQYAPLTDDEAAARITSSMRSYTFRKRWHTGLAQMFGSASIGVAKAHHKAKLAHDPRTGELYPLDAPEAIFDSFGEGVSAFMRSTPKFHEFFLFLFFLSLSNMISNIYGGALGEAVITPLNIATIGNLRELTPSYGVMELVIGFFCVRFLFQMSAFLASEVPH